MFFVLQCIETKTGEGDDAKTTEQWGFVSKHSTRTEADAKATEVSKTAPGTFYVAQGLAVCRPAPKMETL